MSPIKEPNYFGLDLKFRRSRIEYEAYLDLFKSATHFVYRGEASVTYMLSRGAPLEIKAFNPQARIIILIRDPVEVMYARYAQNFKAGIETIKTFADALQAENRRHRGKDIPRGAPCDDWLYYREWVKYSIQLERFLQAFGYDNVFVGLYDDLSSDPEQFYLHVLSFLGLRCDELPILQPVNTNKRVRSILAVRLVRGYVRLSRLLAKLLLPHRRLRLLLADAITKMNTFEAPRDPLPIELSTALRRELESEVSYVERIVGRDLSHWKSAR